MIGTVVIFLTLLSASDCFDCTGQPDGIQEVGCKTYVTCANGIATTTECDFGLVFNHEIGACDLEANVGSPCGLVRKCIEDGTFADLILNCTSYYTCHNNVYFGHNFCVEGTVFDEDLNICSWPWMVSPPCGTRQ